MAEVDMLNLDPKTKRIHYVHNMRGETPKFDLGTILVDDRLLSVCGGFAVDAALQMHALGQWPASTPKNWQMANQWAIEDKSTVQSIGKVGAGEVYIWCCTLLGGKIAVTYVTAVTPEQYKDEIDRLNANPFVRAATGGKVV
jgi:hypothetical protein